MFPWVQQHILTILLISPLAAVFSLVSLPRRYRDAAFEISLAGSGLTLFLSFVVLQSVSLNDRFALVQKCDWLSPLGSSYLLAVDGMSALLLFVVSAVTCCTVVLYWKNWRGEAGAFLISLHLFAWGLVGCLASRDLLLMFLFMEIAAVSLGMMALFFGGRPSARTKTFPRFFGFISVSHGLFLIVTALLLLFSGSGDLNFIERVNLPRGVEGSLFLIMLVGAACRMGLWPFGSWVRELSISLDAKSLPLLALFFSAAAYFFFRLLPVLGPSAAAWSPVVSWVVVASILISALISLKEEGMPLFLSLLTIYFGFVFLGLVSASPQGFAGSLLLMIATVPVLTLFAVLSRRFSWEGLFLGSLLYRFSFFVVILALAGIPGFSQFPGLVMIVMGLFKGQWILSLAALFSFVVASIASVRLLDKVLLADDSVRSKKRVTVGEFVFILPFIVTIVGIGLFPDWILKYVKSSTEAAWKIFQI